MEMALSRVDCAASANFSTFQARVVYADRMGKLAQRLIVIGLALTISGCLEVNFIGLESLRHKSCIARTGLPCDD